MEQNKINQVIYKIIKNRKRKENINYFDYEMIIGYDYLSYSKALENAINKILSNKKSKLIVEEYINSIIENKGFNYETPLKGINKSKSNFLSYRFNEIEDYVIEKEKDLLNKLKKYDINTFYNLNIEILGFNNNINKILNDNQIYTIKQLEEMENELIIDKNIKKIIYTKYFTLKKIIFNIDTANKKYISISSEIENDYKNYYKLRNNNIYTIEDLMNIDYKELKKILNTCKKDLYYFIKRIHDNNIYLKDENKIIYDIEQIKQLDLQDIINSFYYHLRKALYIHNLENIGDLDNIGIIKIDNLNKLMLKEFNSYYLNDLIINACYSIDLKSNNYKVKTKNYK